MLIAPKPQEAEWREVLGARVLFAPITRQAFQRGRRAAMKAAGTDGDVDVFELGDELSYALLMEGILDWGEGFVEEVEEDGETVTRPIACTPESKALFLSDPLFFDAFDSAYVVPFVNRERAKNAPAGSSSGTSSRVTPAKDIAEPSAAETGAATNAPTANTKSTTTKSRKRSTS